MNIQVYKPAFIRGLNKLLHNVFKIHVYSGVVKVGEIDLLTTGLQPDNWITLNGGEELRVDLEFRYATTGGSHDTAPPGSGTISLELVYSTVNTETPP